MRVVFSCARSRNRIVQAPTIKFPSPLLYAMRVSLALLRFSERHQLAVPYYSINSTAYYVTEMKLTALR